MSIKTIAVVGTGDMGSAVGRVLLEHGYHVITDLSGRSSHSARLAAAAGLEDAGDLTAAVRRSDILLSIMPPAAAEAFARSAADVIPSTGGPLIYVDCNAVSPAKTIRIGECIAAAGADFVDAGIIGAAPGASEMPPRFYVSGPVAERLLELDGKGIGVVAMGTEIGRASAIKMTFAALTKGTNALRTAVLLAGERLGVGRELRREFHHRLPQEFERMGRIVPYLAADAGRWSGEMREIRETFESAGITGGFHEAAEWVFEVLAQSELAREHRSDIMPGRTLEEAVTAFLHALDGEPSGMGD